MRSSGRITRNTAYRIPSSARASSSARAGKALPGSLGLDTFGIFMRIGGAGRMPLTYVDNCADAIVLAGLVPGVEGELFNVMDDGLPQEPELPATVQKAGRPVPVRVDPLSDRLPPLLALGAVRELVQGTAAPGVQPPQLRLLLKGHRYSNCKLKDLLGWECRVPMKDALDLYFRYQKDE